MSKFYPNFAEIGHVKQQKSRIKLISQSVLKPDNQFNLQNFVSNESQTSQMSLVQVNSDTPIEQEESSVYENDIQTQQLHNISFDDLSSSNYSQSKKKDRKVVFEGSRSSKNINLSFEPQIKIKQKRVVHQSIQSPNIKPDKGIFDYFENQRLQESGLEQKGSKVLITDQTKVPIDSLIESPSANAEIKNSLKRFQQQSISDEFLEEPAIIGESGAPAINYQPLSLQNFNMKSQSQHYSKEATAKRKRIPDKFSRHFSNKLLINQSRALDLIVNNKVQAREPTNLNGEENSPGYFRAKLINKINNSVHQSQSLAKQSMKQKGQNANQNRNLNSDSKSKLELPEIRPQQYLR